MCECVCVSVCVTRLLCLCGSLLGQRPGGGGVTVGPVGVVPGPAKRKRKH